MGGNAIKRVSVIRLKKDEYDNLGQEVLSRLKNNFPSGDFRIIPAYNQKTDFGDLDLLFSFPEPIHYEAFHDLAPGILDAADVVNNGDVTSIGMPIDSGKFFQVDLIKSSPEEIDFSMLYFAYNDIGNLAGRIARFLGLKFGHNGLHYTFYPEGKPDHAFRSILITKDVDRALEVLGYSPERYHNASFDTYEDIFDFVKSSKYMMESIFLSSNQKHNVRKREKVRPINKAFLQHLRATSEELTWPYSYEDKVSIRRNVFESLMRDESFRISIEQAEQDYESGLKFRALFSGKLVGEWTGLSGVELGSFIQMFRGDLTKAQFQDKIIKMNKIEIRNEVMSFFDAWKEGAA